MLIDTKLITRIKPCLYYNQIYDDSFVMSIHKHNTLEIMYVASGLMSFEYLSGDEKKNVDLNQNNFIIVKPNVPHRIYFTNEAHIYNVEFESQHPLQKIDDLFFDNSVASAFPSMIAYRKKFTDVLIFDDGNEVFRTLKKLQLFLSKKTTDTEFELSFTLLLSQLLADIAGSTLAQTGNEYGNIYLRKAVSFINKNVSDPITVADVCEATGVSKVYVEKLFRDAFGMTVKKKIEHIRIERARKMLGISDAPSSEIGRSLGYENNQSFINNFKAVTGMTPTEFRRKNNLEYHHIRAYEKAYFDERFKKFYSYGKGVMIIDPTRKIPLSDERFDTRLLRSEDILSERINELLIVRKFFFLEAPAGKTRSLHALLSYVNDLGIQDLFLGFFVRAEDVSEKTLGEVHRTEPTRRILVFFDKPPIDYSKLFSSLVTDVALSYDDYGAAATLPTGINAWFYKDLTDEQDKDTNVTPMLLPNYGGLIYVNRKKTV